MPLSLSPAHLILILGAILILVGPGKLPQTGAALGQAIRSFREGLEGREAGDVSSAFGTERQQAGPAAPQAYPPAIPAPYSAQQYPQHPYAAGSQPYASYPPQQIAYPPYPPQYPAYPYPPSTPSSASGTTGNEDSPAR